MKALSLPISSPSRAGAEKLTPPRPMTRFVSGDVVSRTRTRTRTRTRAIPIFSKMNAAGLIYETTQEPSSPKVTCIGQVRTRRSTIESALNHGHITPIRCRWWWLKRPLFGYKFPGRFRRYRAFRGILFRWVLCCRSSGYGKKVDVREDSDFVVESNLDSGENGNCETKVDQEIVPRNALLLTRCRSVPRRSFFGESTRESCKRGVTKTENEPKAEQNLQQFRNPSSKISPESYTESGNGKNVVKDLDGIFEVAAAHPLLLTRCKSGPGRSA